MAFKLPQLRMAQGSLFAILLRSPWWVSLLVALALFALMRLFLPPLFAVVFALPFVGIGFVRAWRQLQAPSARRIEEVLESVRAMGWEAFSARLRQAWEAQGAQVAKAAHPGADFLVSSQGRVAVVAARRWKAAHNGLEVLQALQAARDKLDAHDAIFVATGELSEPARAFAARHLIRIGDGLWLLDLLSPRPGSSPPSKVPADRA